MPATDPQPGQIWAVNGTDGHRHALFLGDGIWNVITRSNDEYTLGHLLAPEPLAISPVQSRSLHWADQFDSLAEADGLNITWAGEVSRYREAGLAKAELLGSHRV